jgi:hypothetical protein
MNGNTETIKCNKCSDSKPLSEFYISNGRRLSWCKSCQCEAQKNYRKLHKERLKAYHAQNYLKTKAQRIKRQLAYDARRIETDPTFKLKRLVRDRLRKSVKRAGVLKCSSFRDYIGCTPHFLRQHIESQFSDGMTWDNHGSVWHIDHIVPISFFDLSTASGICAANHFSNLRPLMAHENLSKGNRYVCR